MISARRTANAVGGKTARACDNCLLKRASWYCAADDAFLCQSCDGSVHSANQLAGRHERVLLETACSKLSVLGLGQTEPTWHKGFTRRARTPRARNKGKNHEVNSSIPLVPEMGVLDASLFDEEEEEEKEELLYRVPVFDPFEAELCNASNEITFIVENKEEEACKLDDLQGFDLAADDLELMEFEVDVESLLGKGFDDASCGIDGLGLNSDLKEDQEDHTNNLGIFFDENRVKVEDEEVEEAILGCDLDPITETLDWEFYESTLMISGKEEEEEEEEDEKKVRVSVGEVMVSSNRCNEEGIVKKSSIFLRLNYEEVIDAWDEQGSPWTTGTRPDINSDDYLPDFMGVHWTGNNRSCEGTGRSDGGREARVSRYREKRRTRLFSKKIRYEVRKRNAEKRPRMKGRFVKRETFGYQELILN